MFQIFIKFCVLRMSQDPEIRPLSEPDSETIQRMLPEMPLWVKNPDYDRVRIIFWSLSISCYMTVHEVYFKIGSS